MANCPNCGGAVTASDAFCRQCGTPLGDQGGSPPSEPGGPDRAGGLGAPQRPASAEEARPPERPGRTGGPDDPQLQRRTSSVGRSDGRRGPPPDDGRRDVLKYGVAVAGLAAFGWLLFADDEPAPNGLSMDGEVQRNPQVAVTFSEETDENGNQLILVRIDSIGRADSVSIQCSDTEPFRQIDDPRAGDRFTCGPDELDERGTIVVRATYEGNTTIIQEYEYDFS